MGPLKSIMSAVRNIHRWNSRAPRREFWWVFLGLIGGVSLFAYLDTAASLIEIRELYIFQMLLGAFIPLYIFWLVLLLSVIIRRLRDLGLRTWRLIIFLMPFGLGFLVMGYLMSRRGTSGPNQYGPDPLYVDVYRDVEEFG